MCVRWKELVLGTAVLVDAMPREKSNQQGLQLEQEVLGFVAPSLLYCVVPFLPICSDECNRFYGEEIKKPGWLNKQ